MTLKTWSFLKYKKQKTNENKCISSKRSCLKGWACSVSFPIAASIVPRTPVFNVKMELIEGQYCSNQLFSRHLAGGDKPIETVRYLTPHRLLMNKTMLNVVCWKWDIDGSLVKPKSNNNLPCTLAFTLHFLWSFICASWRRTLFMHSNSKTVHWLVHFLMVPQKWEFYGRKENFGNGSWRHLNKKVTTELLLPLVRRYTVSFIQSSSTQFEGEKKIELTW